MAVCKERGSTVTSSPPPSPQQVAPAPAAATARCAALPAFRPRPHVSPSLTEVVDPSVSSSADAAATESAKKMASSTGGNSSSSSSRFCGACSSVFTAHTVTFSCRRCCKLFHRDCVGYNTRFFPPPDWICPRCPNGERGPLERLVHPSLKGMGVATKHGNMPWCPQCLQDHREVGLMRARANTKTKCRGCGLHTHASCLAKLEIGVDGRWPCDECQRRRDGVAPGNNPVWARLQAARLDGDHKAIRAPRPPSGDVNTFAAAAASADRTGSSSNERTILSIGLTSSRAGTTTSTPTTPTVAGAGNEAPWRVDAVRGGPGGGGAAATPTPVVPQSPLARSSSSLSAQGSPFSAPQRESVSAASGGNAKGKAKAETGDDDDVSVRSVGLEAKFCDCACCPCCGCFQPLT